MGLSAHTRIAIAAKGMVVPDDLSEFTKDGLKTVFQNLRKLPKILVIHTNAGMLIANHPHIPIKVQLYVVSAKSKMRLLVALKFLRYYEMTQHPLTYLWEGVDKTSKDQPTSG